MAEEWGPWIDHDGRGCPLPFGTIAEVTEKAVADGPGFCAGDERTGVIVVICDMIEPWVWGDAVAHIIRYRVRKPRGMAILEPLIADLPQPEKVGA